MDLRDLRYQLQDLNFARLWEDHRGRIVVGAAAAVVLVLALSMAFCGGGGTSVRVVLTERYFFDLNTRRLVVGPATQSGPVDLGGGTYTYPDGPAGSAVEAVVVSCGDGEGVKDGMSPKDLRAVDASVAYLIRQPQSALAAAEKQRAGQPLTPADKEALYASEPLISNVEGKVWTSESSQPAYQLTTRAYGGCGDRPARRVQP